MLLLVLTSDRYLYAENSREPLKLSREMLVRILSYHQVMPSYIDFLCVFGTQDEPRDLRFSSFREQTLISKPARGPAVPCLGRSGRQFQLCYNLKASNCTSPAGTKLQSKEWSIRQAAIHHQFDVETGTSLWIVTKGDKEIKDRIEELNGPDGRADEKNFSTSEECFKRTLDVHMVCCHWSTEEWRSYIQWLEEFIDREVSFSRLQINVAWLTSNGLPLYSLLVVKIFLIISLSQGTCRKCTVSRKRSTLRS